MGLSGSNLYRLSGGTVIPASEALYPAEADLQQLIAENPQLLLGSPGDGQRLYLLRREQPVRDTPDGPALFSIDHLFIDQDGLPVLVEVKRSTDTRIRREVVGQMLDYAPVCGRGVPTNFGIRLPAGRARRFVGRPRQQPES